MLGKCLVTYFVMFAFWEECISLEYLIVLNLTWLCREQKIQDFSLFDWSHVKMFLVKPDIIKVVCATDRSDQIMWNVMQRKWIDLKRKKLKWLEMQLKWLQIMSIHNLDSSLKQSQNIKLVTCNLYYFLHFSQACFTYIWRSYILYVTSN